MGGALGRGRKGLAGPEGLVWSLELFPSRIAPFCLRGRSDPRGPPHTHRLLECPYSLSWSSETYLSFPHLGIGNRGPSLEIHHERKGLPEKTQREDRYQSVWRQGPCLPPPRGKCVVTSGHSPNLSSSQSPQPLPITQVPLCPQ